MTAADAIKIVPYDPCWPEKARDEMRMLRHIFDQARFPLMEHIGSTAVLDLDAKPVIDIVIGAGDMEKARFLIPHMEAKNYVFWMDDKYEDHFLFIKGMPPYGAGRTHHVHIYPAGHAQIRDHLAFRNALRDDPAVRKEYQDLKYNLAAQYGDDREAYTEAKTDFVRKIL